MLVWFQTLVEDWLRLPDESPDHQATTMAVCEHDYDVIRHTDTELTTTECVQAVVHKSWCHSSWYAKRFVRGLMRVIEHMPVAPPLHTFGD